MMQRSHCGMRPAVQRLRAARPSFCVVVSSFGPIRQDVMDRPMLISTDLNRDGLRIRWCVPWERSILFWSSGPTNRPILHLMARLL